MLPKLLYIDPGTGSMLFTVLLSVIGAAVYSVRVLANKLSAGGGRRKRPREGGASIAVFSDNKRYWNVFEPVCRELGKRGREVAYYTASKDDPVFSCGLPYVKPEYLGPGNKAYRKLNSISASVLLSTTPGLDVYQWKRSPGVGCYVHIPHAASEVVLYRMFGLDYYDTVLLSGEYQAEGIRALEKLRSLPAKDLRMVGIPYMDEMVRRLENAGPAPDHPLTVLLAPSWGKGAIFGKYGGKVLDALLSTGYHVIVRPHPQNMTVEKDMMDRIIADHPASDRLEWNFDVDNFEVLRRSDILISDFSGIIFDFTLVYDKPVIYTEPELDLSPYDAWWLKDMPLWTFSALPRLGMRLGEDNMQDVKSIIDSCLTDPRFAEGRRQVKAETWAHFGEGAACAADVLEEKYAQVCGKEDGKA